MSEATDLRLSLARYVQRSLERLTRDRELVDELLDEYDFQVEAYSDREIHLQVKHQLDSRWVYTFRVSVQQIRAH